MDTSHRPHILLVDDDISAIQVLWCLLSDEARIRFAKSAAQALVLAREQVPDLILLDFELPDGNGVDLCRTLRQDPQLADVPVIIVTAHARDDLQVSALEIGAADFISKPLQAAQLLARVRTQLRLHARPTPPTTPALPAPAEGATPPTPAPAAVPASATATATAASTTAAPAPAHPAAPAPPQPVRVLIVDDDVVAIKMLRNALEALSVQFHFATRGEEALKLAAQVRPHIILLDAQLPGLDGFEVCRRLKADPRLSDTPVIFVTRADDPLTEALALESGAVDFIGKPYRPAVLKARVQHALQPRRAAADAAAEAGQSGVWQQWAVQRVQAVLDSQPDALLVFDAADRVEALNAAARTLLGVATSDVQGLGPGALWRRIERGSDPRSALAALPRLDDTGGTPLSPLSPLSPPSPLSPAEASRSDPAALPAQTLQDERWQVTRQDGRSLTLHATLSDGGALTQASLRTLRLRPVAPPTWVPPRPLEVQAPPQLMTLARLVALAQQGAADLCALVEAAAPPTPPAPPQAPLALAARQQERRLQHLTDLVGLLNAQPPEPWRALRLADCLQQAGWPPTALAALPADLPALACDPTRLDTCLRRLLASLLGLDSEAPAPATGAIDLRCEASADRLTLHLQAPGWAWSAAEVRRLRWPLAEPGHPGPISGTALGLAVTHHLLTELGADVQLADDAAVFSFSLPRWDAQGPEAALRVPA
jgi:two-component system cell cycle response regulator